MTVDTAVFTCSICGEPSKDICVGCTKDACANHRCERCKRCSDCCECEVPLSLSEPREAEVQTPEQVNIPAEAVPSFASADAQAVAPNIIEETTHEPVAAEPEASEAWAPSEETQQ